MNTNYEPALNFGHFIISQNMEVRTPLFRPYKTWIINSRPQLSNKLDGNVTSQCADKPFRCAQLSTKFRCADTRLPSTAGSAVGERRIADISRFNETNYTMAEGR